MIDHITGTVKENFDYALQQEEIMRQCGPGDPYYRMAKANVEYYLDCAARLERGLHGIHSKPAYIGRVT